MRFEKTGSNDSNAQCSSSTVLTAGTPIKLVWNTQRTGLCYASRTSEA